VSWGIRLALALALLAGLFFSEQYIEGLGYSRAQAEATAAINQQKETAATLLATETDKARAAESALQAAKNNQEVQDAAHQKTVAGLSARLRKLAGPAGRLRDPNAAGCGCGGGGATGPTTPAPGDRADDSAQSAGLLSAELTELLQRLAREADDINAAYSSCRGDAFAVRQYLPRSDLNHQTN
jgi:hypothetical protein